MQDIPGPDLERLRSLAGRLIPPSAEFEVPGADDPTIFAEIKKELRPSHQALDDLLAVLRNIAIEDVSHQPLDQLLSLIKTACGEAFLVFAVAVIQAYYRDDRVMLALDIEPRPPFPKGYIVEEGDLSLLDPVRSRGPIWRKAT